MRFATLVLCAAIAFGAGKPNPKDDPNQIGQRRVDEGWNQYSVAGEITLGNALSTRVLARARLVDDAEITEYVNRLAQNLAKNSDAQMPLHVYVIEDDTINAFTLPGGHLFVHTGLIEYAASEAQLAGVLAHEIAHVAARHGTRQSTRSTMSRYLSIPLMFAGPWGRLARNLSTVVRPVTFSAFTRAFEDEADNLGLQYTYKTGYDPLAYVEFFERIEGLQRSKPNAVTMWFQAHPPTRKRIERSQNRIAKNFAPLPEYAVNTSEFDRIQERLKDALRRDLFVDDPPDPTEPVLRRRDIDSPDSPN